MWGIVWGAAARQPVGAGAARQKGCRNGGCKTGICGDLKLEAWRLGGQNMCGAAATRCTEPCPHRHPILLPRCAWLHPKPAPIPGRSFHHFLVFHGLQGALMSPQKANVENVEKRSSWTSKSGSSSFVQKSSINNMEIVEIVETVEKRSSWIGLETHGPESTTWDGKAGSGALAGIFCHPFHPFPALEPILGVFGNPGNGGKTCQEWRHEPVGSAAAKSSEIVRVRA